MNGSPSTFGSGRVALRETCLWTKVTAGDQMRSTKSSKAESNGCKIFPAVDGLATSGDEAPHNRRQLYQPSSIRVMLMPNSDVTELRRHDEIGRSSKYE